MTTATHNGTSYRVIYTAQGNMWSQDALEQAMITQAKNKANQTNVETAVMVHRVGVQATARHYGVSYMAITKRVRSLERELGFVIFPPYDYGQPTYRGRLLLGVTS